jgi:hypothetical protein
VGPGRVASRFNGRVVSGRDPGTNSGMNKQGLMFKNNFQISISFLNYRLESVEARIYFCLGFAKIWA